MQTAYKAFKKSRAWNEWLTLPILYSNLPLNTQLAITIWDLSPAGGEGARGHAVPFGGTTIPLFDDDNTLQTGRQTCQVHRNQAADGWSSTTTPSTISTNRPSKDARLVEEQADADAAEIERLELLMKKHEMGDIPEDRWLDQLAFRKIEQLQRNALKKRIQAEQAKPDDGAFGNGASGAGVPKEDSEDGIFNLYIEFPRFDHPIVFTDQEYPAPPISNIQSSYNHDVRLKPPPEVSLGPGIDSDGHPGEDPSLGPLIRIYDPEVGLKSNPVEDKHRKLMRGNRSTLVDRDLKPNARNRDDLNVSISSLNF